MHLCEYLFMMNKTLRQRAVLDVLKHGSIASQEDLQRLLRKRGFKVGQATLSRDIRDLNLSKTSHGYSLPHGDSGAGIALPPVSRLVREFVLDIRSRAEPAGHQDHCGQRAAGGGGPGRDRLDRSGRHDCRRRHDPDCLSGQG